MAAPEGADMGQRDHGTGVEAALAAVVVGEIAGLAREPPPPVI